MPAKMLAGIAAVSMAAFAFPACAAPAQQPNTVTVASADQPAAAGDAAAVTAPATRDEPATGGPMRLSPLAGTDEQAMAAAGRPLNLPRKARPH